MPHPSTGRDMADLADELQLEVDELFPMAETLQLMRFADLSGGDLALTPVARRYAEADVDQRKEIFAHGLLRMSPSPSISAASSTSAPTTPRRRAAFVTSWRITCRPTVRPRRSEP